jgi:hypothetical protein
MPIYATNNGNIGDYNTVSGVVSQVSGSYVDLSGDYVTTSGDYASHLHSGLYIGPVEAVDFDVNNGASSQEGRLKWNSTDGTLEVGMPGGDVNLQIGQEMLFRAKNNTGSPILNGMAVRISGATAGNPNIGLSDFNVPAIAGSVGLATEDISDSQFGFVTSFGYVRDLNTTGYAAGDRLYAAASGLLTNVAPTGDARMIFIGVCISSHATQGMVWVSPINVSHLGELGSVTLTSPQDNDVLAYNNANSIWVNQAGISGDYATTSGAISDYGVVSGDYSASSGDLSDYKVVSGVAAAGGGGATNITELLEEHGKHFIQQPMK